jgi:hypothetical protein
MRFDHRANKGMEGEILKTGNGDNSSKVICHKGGGEKEH